MWKPCATITAIGATILCSLVQAQGITGIYSCSSGVNNERPVTYMFNSDLMVRDNEKDAPFEFVTGLNSGKLLYVGLRPTRTYDVAPWRHGVTDRDLSNWLPVELRRLQDMVNRGKLEETNEDYLLVRAVSCENNDTPELDYLTLAENAFKQGGKYDPNWETSYEQMCDDVIAQVEELGITNPKAELLRRNFEKAPKNELFDTVLVTVDLTTSQVFEAILDKPEKTQKYNCTVLNIDVPKIDPPENAIKAST